MLYDVSIFLLYVLVYIVLMMFLYVHPCMNVNTVTSYVIELHYVVWCHVITVTLLCYHVVMSSW